MITSTNSLQHHLFTLIANISSSCSSEYDASVIANMGGLKSAGVVQGCTVVTMIVVTGSDCVKVVFKIIMAYYKGSTQIYVDSRQNDPSYQTP
jgi:capsular polysaccharide biosynthesis protein